MSQTVKTTAAAALVAVLAIIASCTSNGPTRSTDEPEVKLSRNAICHARGTASYAQTKNYTPFDSLEACLQQGRLPGSTQQTAQIPAYDRDAFGGWIDPDGNCLNTRQEVLQQLSTAAVEMKSACTVGFGRWLDPYTNQVFTKASDLDIDHIVPLAYAWSHGAHAWPAEKRVQFANDPVNLLAVQASANRSKGSAGPTEWLPPDTGYRCQYVLRFQRIASSYGLTIPADENRQLQDLKSQYC